MSSLTYTQHYSDRTSKLVRRLRKQGRPEKDESLKVTHRVTINLTESEYQMALEKANGMKLNQYGKIAMCLFDMELFVQKIG